MVEYTSDICRVDSSNLFKPISSLSGGMVDALNLEFSFLIIRSLRVQVSSEVNLINKEVLIILSHLA